MVTLYGIPNCDTVRKARAWLDAHGVAYAFHDYRKGGVPVDRVRGWAERLGWEALLNRRGTTFRGLPEAARAALDAEQAIGLMLAHPSIIKRPVVEADGRLLVGFSPETWTGAFG